MKSTSLSFEAAKGANTLLFPDATGTIISTGNLEDIHNNIALRGRDNMVVHHHRQLLATTLHGKLLDSPFSILDVAQHGSREDTSLGLTAVAFPPGSSKGRLPSKSQLPRGLWHIADLGPRGVYGDGDDLVSASFQHDSS